MCLCHKSRACLFDKEKGTDGEGIYAGAIETADGTAGIGDEGLAEKVEGSVYENGGGGGFTEFVEEFPEERIGFAVDGVNTNYIAIEGEAFEAGDGIFECGERGHGEAIGRGVEIFGGALGGHGESKGVEFLAVLDELIDIFDHIFGEGRSEEAAIAEGAMAKFGAALTPGDDFIAVQEGGGFFYGLIFTGQIVIGDFAIIEDGFDFVGIGVDANREICKRAAARVSGELFAREVGRAQGGSGVAGDGLYVDVIEARAGFEGADEKNIQEDSASEAEGAGTGGLLKICRELENDFFETILGAAGQVGAEGRCDDEIAPGEAEFAIKRRSEKALTIRASGEIAAIQRREAAGAPVEKLAKSGEKFWFAVFAEPLEFMFITAGTKAGEFGDARIKPA